jgi:nucleotide-binding universal stress UspA family protein
MGKVLIGLDGSSGAQRALEWAVDVAAKLDHTLCPVYVQRYELPPEHVTLRAVGPVLPSADERRRAAGEVLDAAFEKAGPVPEGLRVEREVVFDADAADVLVERSKEADLLVLGTRGHGTFTGMLLGSVSLRCVTHAHCPVVVVPPHGGV